jgi:hypothetical protein
MEYIGSGHLSGEDYLGLSIPERNVTVGQVKQKIQDELIPRVREFAQKRHSRETLMSFGATHLFRTKLGKQGMPAWPIQFFELGPDDSLLWEDHGQSLPYKRWGKAQELVHFYVDLCVNIQVVASPSGVWPEMDPTIFTNGVLKLTVMQNYWETSHIDDIKVLIQQQTGWNPLGLHIMWKGKELVREQKRFHLTNRINRESIFHPRSIQHGSTLQIWVHERIIS